MTPPTGQPKVTDADLEWWEAWHAALPALQRPDSLAMATARLAAIVPRLVNALRTERAAVRERDLQLEHLLHPAQGEEYANEVLRLRVVVETFQAAVRDRDARIAAVRDLCDSYDVPVEPLPTDGPLERLMFHERCRAIDHVIAQVRHALDGPR